MWPLFSDRAQIAPFVSHRPPCFPERGYVFWSVGLVFWSGGLVCWSGWQRGPYFRLRLKLHPLGRTRPHVFQKGGNSFWSGGNVCWSGGGLFWPGGNGCMSAGQRGLFFRQMSYFALWAASAPAFSEKGDFVTQVGYFFHVGRFFFWSVASVAPIVG